MKNTVTKSLYWTGGFLIVLGLISAFNGSSTPAQNQNVVVPGSIPVVEGTMSSQQFQSTSSAKPLIPNIVPYTPDKTQQSLGTSTFQSNTINGNSYTTPYGATAVCGDGTYSFSQHRQGTCSHHGGVAQWL